MKLSVLVTFYNQKDYVDRALRSILLQNTDFEYEILVGDDGSTDGTLDKIKEWQAKYPNKISVYIMDRQEGKKYNCSFRASRNRINLLKYVKGKYFTYLDGDDYFCNNNKFQKQIAFLENDNEKRFSMCAHNVYSVDGKSGTKTIFLKKMERNMKLKAKDYWKKYYFHPDSIIFRSEYIKEIKYNLVKDYFNDNMIVYSFLQHGDIYYMADIMACYTQTGDGIWTGSSKYVGCLRNLMDMDLEIKINDDFWVSSLIRHFWDIYYFVFRKNVNNESNDKIKFYLKQIAKDKLYNTEILYRYNVGKKRFSIKAYSLFFKAMIAYILFNMKWIVKRNR